MATRSQPPGASAVLGLLEKIAQSGQAFCAGDHTARESLLQATREMVHALEYPMESLMRLLWAEPAHHSVIRCATEINLFDLLAENDGAPKTTEELAAKSKAEPLLTARMLRFLSAQGTTKEVDKDLWTVTPIAQVLAKPHVKGSIKFCQDFHLPINVKTPTWFAEHDWKSPTDAKDCPFTLTYDLKDTNIFEYFPKHPVIAGQFAGMMQTFGADRPLWIDPMFYPVSERLITGAREGPDEVLLVDVGGGKGHILQEFKRRYPEAKGRLINQDRPEIIAIDDLHEGFEAMVHDFNKPQVIEGARGYGFRLVLHDWDDEAVIHILKQIVPVMAPGYSKVLLSEHVLPDKGAEWKLTTMDWQLMTSLAACERTKTQWTHLIESAGLKVTGMFQHPASVDSLIECELAG